MTESNAHATDSAGIYLDYAAATPVDPEVVAAMLPYLTDDFYNPSAPYAKARRVKADLERARATLAHLIGAQPANVVLTAGATEANNLAFSAVSGEVAVSAIEHASVLACAQAHPSCLTIPVKRDGGVEPAAVASSITPQTELVSIALANGEVGTIQPIRKIAQVVRAERARRLEAGEQRPLWLHTDASQAAGCLSVSVSSLGADLITLSAAKLYGPKQVGLLWAADGVRLKPLVRGGGQEGGVRSGTENVAGVVGFARALELAAGRRSSEAARLKGLRNRLQQLLTSRFEDAVVFGPSKDRQRLPGLLALSFPGLDARRLVILLEQQGVSVGTGSACAASKMQASPALLALGATPEQAAGSLRITLGRPTTGEEVDAAARAIIRAVEQERERVSGKGGSD